MTALPVSEPAAYRIPTGVAFQREAKTSCLRSRDKFLSAASNRDAGARYRASQEIRPSESIQVFFSTPVFTLEQIRSGVVQGRRSLMVASTQRSRSGASDS
jgi:hypothetical protein